MVLDQASAEKLFAAERRIAGFRLAVIASGTVIYPFLLDHTGTVEWLAYALLGLAWVYGLHVYLREPYRRNPLLLSGYFTTLSDAFFTMLWLYATGGWESPFYVALYMAVAAVGFRFGWRETLVAAVAYGAGYALLLAMLGELLPHPGEATVRITYILLAAMLGAVIARETLQQTREKQEMGRLAAEAQAARDALRVQTDLYESLVRTQSDLGDGVAVTERERIVFANEALACMYGYTVKELLALPSFLDLVAPEERAALAERLRRRLGGEAMDSDRGEATVVRKDGRRIRIEYGLKLLRPGERGQLVAIVRDVTERKRAEEALRESEERWRALSESAPDIILTLDRQGTILFINRVLEGFDRAKVIGTSALAFVSPGYHARYRGALERVFAGQTDAFEMEAMGADGKPDWYASRLAPIFRDGRVVAATVVATDVTLRRAAEEALRRSEAQLAEAQRIARMGSWEWDIAANHVTWSEELWGLYGLEPSSLPLTYEAFLERVHPDDREMVKEAVGRSFATHQPFGFEHRVVWPDGSVRWLYGAGRVFADDQGRAVRMAGTGQDITERKLAEEERRYAQDRLRELERFKELDRFKTQFLNTAAHELNTPLTPIKLQLHLLHRSLGPAGAPEQRKGLDILERNFGRLEQLVQDVLQSARLQAGRLGIERAPFDLAQLVRDESAAFEEPARVAGVRLEVRAAAPVPVVADPKRLTQVLYNLLTNALKFTPAGGVVTVAAFRAGDVAVVRVRDTGAGVRAEDLSKLFQPFVQLHDPSQRTKGGTGLGLYISRGLVELHGGRIWAESAGAGRGSTFAFEIPAESPVGRVVESKAVFEPTPPAAP